ncbi:MAG: hypothetical protein EAZ08_11655 [Cytophagales bacterium]|nr:MAG: hypothetical protein EAZ08_11655 [Cytophagales bacterium]
MGIIIPILGIMTGMIAIIANAYIKVQKMKIERLDTGDAKLLIDRVNLLERENAQLKERVENMETIVGDIDIDLLKIGSGTSSVRK